MYYVNSVSYYANGLVYYANSVACYANSATSYVISVTYIEFDGKNDWNFFFFYHNDKHVFIDSIFLKKIHQNKSLLTAPPLGV